jgi:hypothetical protein
MKFEEKDRITYCKDNSYNKKHDHGENFFGFDDNNIEYYRGYLIHKEDGPAMEYVNNNKYWYINGWLHRDNGPAIEYGDGSKSWYLNGKRLEEKEYWKIINCFKNKRMVLDEV